MEQPNLLSSVFGTYIKNLGTADSVEQFLSIVKIYLHGSNDHSYFFRGESKIYESTSLKPKLVRKPGWLQNEHRMINDFVAKFPDKFPKGTSTFDIMINADHFSLPTRLLDISYSAFTGLFIACYNFSFPTKVDTENDGFVYIFKVPKKDIKNWNSDTVTLLSNIARMKPKFPFDKGWMKSISILMHTIKDEKPDFYKMYADHEIKKYKNDFNQIVCVESKMLNPRIINQKGLFFLFGINRTKMDFDKMRFGKDVEIYSIRIDKNHKRDILNQLEMCGYDKMTMFPDMEKVCENISEKYENL